MDSSQVTRKKANNESGRSIIKNNMYVWSDDENESIMTSTVSFDTISTTLNSRIILHDGSKSVNSMSNNSDSDSDFDLSQSTYRTPYSNLSKKRENCKIAVKTSSKKKRYLSSTNSVSSSKNVEKQSQNNNISSVEKSPQKINIISDEPVNISINSIANKSVSNKDVQIKPRLARNIFPSSSEKDTENVSTQTDFKRQTSNENTVFSSTHISHRSVEVQTESENKISSTSKASTASLKRPHSVGCQTDFKILRNEQNKEEVSVRRKMTKIEVTPPNRLQLQTIHEECPLLRLADEHKKKIEAAKINLMEVFSKTSTSDDDNIASKTKIISSTKSKSTTPMKQLTIPELIFYKRNNRTPNTSPTKSISNEEDEPPVYLSRSKFPMKEFKLKKIPEKKVSRYSQESHRKLYENVKKIINWVFNNAHFNILFTKSETDLLKKLLNFKDINLAIMCLRLYSRQHKWYNFKNLCEELNLSYKDLNLNEFYKNLTAGFVCSDYSGEKIEELLEYLNLPDIKDICNSFKIRVVLQKKGLIAKLLEYSRTQCTLSSLKNAHQILREHIKNKLGICIKLETNVRDILYRVHLLYSLCNPELETASDIYNLMYKINEEIVTYPKIKTDSAIMFSTRQDFLKFTEAKILRKEFYDQYEKKNISSEYFICVEAYNRLKKLLCEKSQIRFDRDKPLYLRQFSAAWVYCKVLNAGSQNLGKEYSDDVCNWLREMLKQDVYCINNRGYWYSQLALVTKAHKKDVTGEVQIIIDGLSDKYVNEVQKHELSIRGSKIRKGKVSQMLYDKLQCLLLPSIDVPVIRTIQANVVHNNEPGRKLLFERRTAEGKEYSSVEQTAINYYTEKGNFTHGIHCEGQLWDALFIILFYDVIYNTYIPNTFITELQYKPLDLFSGEFYSNRTNKIKSLIQEIKHSSFYEVCQLASEIYGANIKELTSLINFDFVKEDTLQVIIKCIGPKLLADILERFAKDYKQFHSGLPDLFLWNCKTFKCCFVEVKSEKDRLSTKQLLWINYLHNIGAKVEVCHVEHIGSTSTKKKKN